MGTSATTLLDRLWAAHEVCPPSGDQPAVLYVDLHLLHEVSSPQAFATLRERGLAVRRPGQALATMDHATPTDPAQLSGRKPFAIPAAAAQVELLAANCREFGIRLFDLGDARRGIVHVIGPELGLTQPGRTIVCGDSHTSTHGAFGALAFGIGTTEAAHVLATQCVLQRKPAARAVTLTGRLSGRVTAKDLVLAVIARAGADWGTGSAIEFRGPTVAALSMEERMTVCNMAIEAGARSGLMAPDDTTFAYLEGRPFAPAGADFRRAVDHWQQLVSDPDAAFEAGLALDAGTVAPMITWGTNPSQAMAVDSAVPAPRDTTEEQALRYMGLRPGEPLLGKPVRTVFIGSCTNGRLSDLRAAAGLLRGRRVAAGVRLLVVPGSGAVKAAAEAEGLDGIFSAAGADWREPGCSMCIGMNGDTGAAGEYLVSTSNRNFEGRQGPGVRTLLASPLTAAASALAGAVADPRALSG